MEIEVEQGREAMMRGAEGCTTVRSATVRMNRVRE